MDELVISDRRYISTRRAGKEHGYHSDYIGQLIRSDKVQGQKVGRAWYVDAESLANYLGKEYSQSIASAISAPIATPAALSEFRGEISIEAPVEILPAVEETQKEPVREEIKEEKKVEIVAAPQTQAVQPEPEVHRILIHKPQVEEAPSSYKGLKYIPDDEPLLPEIHPVPITSRYPEPFAEAPRQGSDARRKKMNRPIAGLAVLAGVGVAAIALSAAASALVSSTISVIDGQNASVSYSIGQ